MRLTTRGRYAVTAMLDLALHGADATVALADVAERQELSLTYLEQLFNRLRRASLVSSARGPGGGYRLARPAEEISVADVIAAVDESVDATRCGGARNCHGRQRCLTHDLWESLSHEIEGFLSRITLATLVAKAPESAGALPAAAVPTQTISLNKVQGRRG